MDQDEVQKRFDKEVNDRICPECHAGLLYPSPDIPNYAKCCLCGFARFTKDDKKIEEHNQT